VNSYSYSRLKAFKQCPYCYWLHYLNRSMKDKEQGHGVSEFGTLCHEVLEKYGRGELAEWELLDEYKELYPQIVVDDSVLWMSEDFTKDMGPKYYEDGEKFFTGFGGFDFNFVEVELPFEVQYHDFLLNGRIDCIAEDYNEKKLLIDYKSKGNWKNKAERLEYEKQLYIYAYALKKIHGYYPDKMAFFHFRTNKWTWTNFDEVKLDLTLKWAEKTVKEIEAAKTYPAIVKTNEGKFDFYCWNFCPYRDCCKYKMEMQGA